MEKNFKSIVKTSSKNQEDEETLGNRRVKNSQNIMIRDIEKKLGNWNIPRMDKWEVYQKGSFDFRMTYAIKTVEKIVPIMELDHQFELFSNKMIKDHLEHNYNYLHVGLVQIALKPLTRNGLNTSVIIALRDQRHNKFSDSLLGIVESSLCDGPIFFNCHPNFTVSLKDPHIMKTLTANIMTSGFDMLEGSQNLALVYRIYYKVMTTQIEPKALEYDTRGETLLLKANTEKSNIVVPKPIKWKDVRLPEKWIFQNNQPIKNVKPQELERIIEYDNGEVEICFSKDRITKIDFAELNTKKTPSRISYKPSSSRASTSQIPESEYEKLTEGIKESTEQVSHPIYQMDPITIEGNKQENTKSISIGSPNPSFSDFQLNVLQEPFKFDPKSLNEDYWSKKNDIKRKWYFDTYTLEERKEIKHLWYRRIMRNKQNLRFFEWFIPTLVLDEKLTLSVFLVKKSGREFVVPAI